MPVAELIGYKRVPWYYARQNPIGARGFEQVTGIKIPKPPEEIEFAGFGPEYSAFNPLVASWWPVFLFNNSLTRFIGIGDKDLRSVRSRVNSLGPMDQQALYLDRYNAIVYGGGYWRRPLQLKEQQLRVQGAALAYALQANRTQYYRRNQLERDIAIKEAQGEPAQEEHQALDDLNLEYYGFARFVGTRFRMMESFTEDQRVWEECEKVATVGVQELIKDHQERDNPQNMVATAKSPLSDYTATEVRKIWEDTSGINHEAMENWMATSIKDRYERDAWIKFARKEHLRYEREQREREERIRTVGHYLVFKILSQNTKNRVPLSWVIDRLFRGNSLLSLDDLLTEAFGKNRLGEEDIIDALSSKAVLGQVRDPNMSEGIRGPTFLSRARQTLGRIIKKYLFS